MSLAFEITVEDVSQALSVSRVSAHEVYEQLDFDLIEDAALQGSNMDQQLTYAHIEIKRQAFNM